MNLLLKISSHFFEEKKYAFKILLSDILGLSYVVEKTDHKTQSILVIDKTQKIVFEDSFFLNIDSKYLIKDLPKKVNNLNFRDKHYPILYGNPKIRKSRNQFTLDADIIASTFFFASRWEESLITTLDSHKRVSAKDSYLFKNNLLDVPWVEEYALLLKLLILDLSPNTQFIISKFNVHLTHDLDNPLLFNSFTATIKYFGILLLRDFNIKEIVFGIKSIFNKKDPYDTTDYLMQQSNSIEKKSIFYLLAGENGEKDFRYSLSDKRIKETIKNIKNDGHQIAIHPGISTFENSKQLTKEVMRIRAKINTEINESRQHFLKFDILKTPQILEANNIKVDSTICYHDYIGFRTGICREHSLFDLKNRKTLIIRERPLSIMDTSLRKYLKLSKEDALTQVVKTINTIKIYKGDFVLLWHNSSFNTYYWKPYHGLYNQIIKYLRTI